MHNIPPHSSCQNRQKQEKTQSKEDQLTRKTFRNCSWSFGHFFREIGRSGEAYDDLSFFGLGEAYDDLSLLCRHLQVSKTLVLKRFKTINRCHLTVKLVENMEIFFIDSSITSNKATESSPLLSLPPPQESSAGGGLTTTTRLTPINENLQSKAGLSSPRKQAHLPPTTKLGRTVSWDGNVDSNLSESSGSDSHNFKPLVHSISLNFGLPVQARTMTTSTLLILTFYSVSGGPFGIESAVGTAGALYSLLGFIIMPLLWAVPEAMITAELSTAYPESAGFVAWVEEAYGSKLGLLEGYLSWMSGVTDNSLYPVLFMKYLLNCLGEESILATPIANKIFLLASCITMSYINYRGLHVVGKVTIVIAFVSMIPFVILCVLSIPKIDPK